MGANAQVERMWDVATTHTVVWPSGPLDAERVAKACMVVAASVEPGSFVARRIAAAAQSVGLAPGTFLDRHRQLFVDVAEHRTRDALVVELTGAERKAVPFWFVVCPGGFALVHSHDLGDGSVSAALLESVLLAYAGVGATRRVPGRVARDRDLVRALVSLWLRRPSVVPDTIAGVVRHHRRRPTSVTHLAAETGVRLEAWEVARADLAALDRWRLSRPEQPSMSVALLWTVARALASHGYPAGPQRWQVVVGMRGRMPTLQGFGGNLVGRALVDVDPDGDPAVPTGQLRRQVISGEVLALHLAKLGARQAAEVVQWLRSAVRGRRGFGQERPRRFGNTPGLSWSDRGRRAFGDGFAAAIPSVAVDGHTVDPLVHTFVTPGIDGISVNVNWVDERPGLLIAFGASPMDDCAADAVMRSLRGGVGELLGPDLPAV